MDIQKSINYVTENGNELELARLSNIFGQDFDSASVLNGFSTIQNPDGGFPYGDRPGFPSCLSNTAQAVHVLQELGLEESDIYQASIRYFMEMQREGIWPENEKIAPLGPPPWDIPGDDKTTLWLTADITDLLLRSGFEGDLSLAIDFIKEHQAPDGKFMGFIHTTWMALSVFGKSGINDVQVFSDALAYLETMDIIELDSACIAWCLDCMKKDEIARESLLWQKLLDRLAYLQEDDGAWPAEEGEHTKTRNINSVLSALQDII
ncbi:MAG: terpene cyclase/mutase family protein [Thermoplasmata archaeon]|nr:terpene cyclase/mutase family protein [Thermoplasmata archaeon]